MLGADGRDGRGALGDEHVSTGAKRDRQPGGNKRNGQSSSLKMGSR